MLCSWTCDYRFCQRLLPFFSLVLFVTGDYSSMHRWLLSVAVLTGLLGCGGGADPSKGLPATVPVKGKITLDGQPVEGVVVTFVPTGVTKGIECVGRSDASGNYLPKQLRGNDGVPPGTYKVVFSRLMRGGKPVTPDQDAGGGGIAVESLPAKYSDLATTRQTATVSAKGDQIDFQLTTK